jgi:hypothetical protein
MASKPVLHHGTIGGVSRAKGVDMTRERDLSREIACHLDLAREHLQREGLSAPEARARALHDFGDIDDVIERVRAEWSHRWRRWSVRG